MFVDETGGWIQTLKGPACSSRSSHALLVLLTVRSCCLCSFPAPGTVWAPGEGLGCAELRGSEAGPGFQARRGAGLLRSLAVGRALACLGGCDDRFQFSGVDAWSPGGRCVGSAGEMPGPGGLSDRGAHGSLGAEVPCTCDPRGARPEDGVQREQSQRTPVSHPLRPTGAWSTGRWAPDGRGSPEHSREATGCREEKGLLALLGSLPALEVSFVRQKRLQHRAWEPGLSSQRFRTLGGLRGQQQGPKAVCPPAGVSRPRALPDAGHRGVQSPSGVWGPWALATPGHCTA